MLSCDDDDENITMIMTIMIMINVTCFNHMSAFKNKKRKLVLPKINQ